MRLLLVTCLFLSGCSTLGVRESKFVMPNGQQYLVYCQQDGRCTYKQGDVSVEVDNRGRAGIFEQAAGAVMLGIANVNAKDLK